MIKASGSSAGTIVKNVEVSICPLAIALLSDERPQIAVASRPEGALPDVRSDKVLDEGYIVMLRYVVVETVELITEFKIMRALPSALEPRQVLVKLNSFTGVVACKIWAVGKVLESILLLQGGV